MKVNEIFADSEFENEQDEIAHLQLALKDLRSQIYNSAPGTDKLERLVNKARIIKNRLFNMGVEV